MSTKQIFACDAPGCEQVAEEKPHHVHPTGWLGVAVYASRGESSTIVHLCPVHAAVVTCVLPARLAAFVTLPAAHFERASQASDEPAVPPMPPRAPATCEGCPINPPFHYVDGRWLCLACAPLRRAR